MQYLLKNKFILILAVCLLVSACTVSGPFQPQMTQGLIKGGQLIIGSSFQLKSDGRIDGGIVGIGTSITLDAGSIVDGDITLIGSTLEASGMIIGNINVIAGSSRYTKSAIIDGDINQFFHQADVDTHATISGEINTFTFPVLPIDQITGRIASLTNWFNPRRLLFMQLVRTFVTAILALLAVTFLKKPTNRMADAIQKQSAIVWGAGFFATLATLFIAAILITSIFLSPLGILIILTYIILVVFGWLVLGLVIGRLLQRWWRITWPDELKAFLGMLILGLAASLIGWIPCIGLITIILVGCLGLGGIIISRFGSTSDGNPLVNEPIVVINEPPKPAQPLTNKDKPEPKK